MALSVAFEQSTALLRQRDGALLFVQRDALDESLVFQVSDVESFVSGIAQISFRNDPKGADGRKRPRFASVQRVVAIAVVDQLALQPARQVQVAHKYIARVEADVPLAIARFTVATLAPFVVALADVVVSRADHGRTGATSDRQPFVLAIVNAIVSFARIKIARIEVT